MKRICLLSDTHSYIDDAIIKHINSSDEVWHAGDIGSVHIIQQLSKMKKLRAVYGNIDDAQIRMIVPKKQLFQCEQVKVFMTHIGGYPGRYYSSIKKQIKDNGIKLFISGHSHILKVMYDKELEVLHMNPGAIGKNGFHNVRTMIKFVIDQKEIKDLEIVEFPRR